MNSIGKLSQLTSKMENSFSFRNFVYIKIIKLKKKIVYNLKKLDKIF